MRQSILPLVIFLFAYSMVIAQYVSHVTIPNTSVSKEENPADPSFRYASGISAGTLREHLKIIASDSLEGRETGQSGIKLAADYLQRNIRNLGLEIPPGLTDFFQPVAFTFSKWQETSLFVKDEKFRFLWDYIILPDQYENIAETKVSEVIFLGYGIDDAKYSDYKKVDVKNKVIMINKGEPLDKQGHSIITGNENLSPWSEDMNKKLQLAKQKGVKMVLIIEEDIKKQLEKNRRILFGGNMALGNQKDKVINEANHTYISSTIAKAIIGEHESKIIKSREKMAKGKPAHVELKTNFSFNFVKNVDILEGKNVIGYIKGSTKPDEYIVISAHYDHLGKRGDEIYNGANDNGSGTVTLLELAQACQQAVLEGDPPLRSIVFLWVCGEEKGLLGSEYYTKNPIFPLEKTIADVNVDMLGRTDEKYKDNPNYIYVIGSDRLSSDLHKLSEDVNQKYTQLTLDYTYNAANDPNNYYYRSDHYNFAKNGVPAIFYFNGTHSDYHRTSDDVEKINFDYMANTAKLIFHTLWELANREERIRVDKE
jgi:hypothetical protein